MAAFRLVVTIVVVALVILPASLLGSSNEAISEVALLGLLATGALFFLSVLPAGWWLLGLPALLWGTYQFFALSLMAFFSEGGERFQVALVATVALALGWLTFLVRVGVFRVLGELLEDIDFPSFD